MAALNTVEDYVIAARRLLQDEDDDGYRYPTTSFVDALNFGILEARRIRPDLFLARFANLPSYSADTLDAQVAIDEQYRVAILYYVCAHLQMRDDEDVTDARAGAYLAKFNSQLSTGVA